MAIPHPLIRRPAPAPAAAAAPRARPAAAERPAVAASHDFGAMRVTAADDAHERQARELARRIAPALVPGARPERAPSPAAPLPFRAAASARAPHAGAGRGDGSGAFTAPPGISAAVRGARGGGEPLSAEMQAGAEAALGTGLEGVSLHRDAGADHLARALRARAVTTGRDVFFRRGAYAPGTAAGRERIAHELVHVAQQAQGGGAAVAQREFVDDKGGTDMEFNETDWFKKLSPLQQKIANELHADPQKKITVAEAVGAVRAEENRRVGAAARPGAHPFMARLGYASSAYDQDLVEPDDDTLAGTLNDTNKHYRGQIKLGIEGSKETWEKELAGSSDSETEVMHVVGTKAQGVDPVAAELSVRARRRAYKGSQLTALARTFFSLEGEEMKFHDELAVNRARDNKERPDKLQMYAGDTRTHFARVGEQFKQTSLYHNPYLRRAFRTAINLDQVNKGGSHQYDTLQGKIREKLLEALNQDQEKMQWTRDDFADDRTWTAVQFMMRQKISNNKEIPSFHESLEAGTELEKASPLMAFHHVAWKEAMDEAFTGFALTPANLTALNDLREVMNVKKLKLLKVQGLSKPPVGAHDKIGHQLTGFPKDHQKEFERATKGGHFKDIDLEAVHYTLLPLLRPRTRKRFLYDPGVIAPKVTPPQEQHGPVVGGQLPHPLLKVDLSGKARRFSYADDPTDVQEPEVRRKPRANRRAFKEDVGYDSDSGMEIEGEDRPTTNVPRKPTKKDAKIQDKARLNKASLYAQMHMAESDEDLPRTKSEHYGKGEKENLSKKVKTEH